MPSPKLTTRRILAFALLGVLVGVGSRALADVPSGPTNWLEIVLVLAVPVATLPMQRRKRGILLFLWLFVAGVLVLCEMLVGITAPSAAQATYGVVLCALGWLIKFRETSPDKIQEGRSPG